MNGGIYIYMVCNGQFDLEQSVMSKSPVGQTISSKSLSPVLTHFRSSGIETVYNRSTKTPSLNFDQILCFEPRCRATGSLLPGQMTSVPLAEVGIDVLAVIARSL